MGTSEKYVESYQKYLGLSLDDWIAYNKALVKKYPFLIPRNVFSGEIVNDYDYTWTEADVIPIGWRIAFGDLLLEELREELIKFDYLDKYQIVQIKEKYGSLRWYDNGYPQGSNVPDILSKYEIISQNVCIMCGKPDVPMINEWWVSPYCKDCFVKKELEYNKNDDPDKIIEDYEKLKDSAEKIAEVYNIRRFSIGGYEDIKVDISDTVSKIRARYYGSDKNGC